MRDLWEDDSMNDSYSLLSGVNWITKLQVGILTQNKRWFSFWIG